ncbi:MAG: domain, FtsQ-type, partial [Chloroflexota bacterium]|nr:domain, FtsQ-type [Chloroflexota bacterium]
MRRPTAWTALAVGCALALVVIALSGSPRVARVGVSGTRNVSAETVMAAAGLVGRPAFTTSTADARAAVLALAAVREARVRILLPDRAQIEIVERDPVARWVAGDVTW